MQVSGKSFSIPGHLDLAHEMPGQFEVILIMLEMLLQSQSQIEFQFSTKLDLDTRMRTQITVMDQHTGTGRVRDAKLLSYQQ